MAQYTVTAKVPRKKKVVAPESPAVPASGALRPGWSAPPKPAVRKKKTGRRHGG